MASLEEQRMMEDAADSSVQVDTGSHWQRLATIAIMYFTASNIKGVAKGLIYAVPALAVTFNQAGGPAKDYLYVGGAVLILLMAVSGLASFLMYRFRVHNQHIEIQSGVFSRKYTNLPFWRIQNVKIDLPFYYRPFKYALLVLDTAGSAGEEARIVAVPLHYAHALKRQVLAHHKNVEVAPTAPQSVQDASIPSHDTDVDEVVLNRRSIGDIVIHGITNNRVWILLGVAAPFYDDAITLVSSWLAEKGLQLNQLVGEQAIAWWQFGLYALVIVMMIMALLALLSVGGALFTFYGYTLSRSDDRYIRRSGLLNKQEVSMRASRIQMIKAKQDWLDKILKRVNLYFEQNTTVGKQVQELMSPNKLIVPSVTENEVATLTDEVMPGCKLHRHDFITISKRFIVHWMVMAWSWPLIGLFAVGFIASEWDIVMASIALGAVLLGLLSLQWWRWGMAYDGKYIYVRQGRIGIDYLCFEPFKVQQVIVKQSVFMKRRKLASIVFVMASGSVTVPFLPEKYVQSIADKVLFEVESTRKSWM